MLRESTYEEGIINGVQKRESDPLEMVPAIKPTPEADWSNQETHADHVYPEVDTRNWAISGNRLRAREGAHWTDVESPLKCRRAWRVQTRGADVKRR